MNNDLFELSLAAALHEKAQEIAMSTNLSEGREILDNNLDRVDAGRRRRIWITGLVAVSATVAVIALVVGVARPSATPEPVTSPTPTRPVDGVAVSSTTFADDLGMFTPDVSLVLPSWAKSADKVSGPGLMSLTQVHDCFFTNTCPDDADHEIFVVQPVAQFSPTAGQTITPHPTARQVVDGWRAISVAGAGSVSDEETRLVGGKPATVFTVTVTQQLWGMIDCDSTTITQRECVPSPAGRTTRVAVIDTGVPTPTVVYLIRDADNPQTARIAADLDEILNTVSFG